MVSSFPISLEASVAGAVGVCVLVGSPALVPVLHNFTKTGLEIVVAHELRLVSFPGLSRQGGCESLQVVVGSPNQIIENPRHIGVISSRHAFLEIKDIDLFDRRADPQRFCEGLASL